MVEIRVLLADDHKTVRAGLRMIVDSEPDMTVVGEAGDGHEAIELTKKLVPDVLVTDISMPEVSGMVAAATVKRIAPSVKILALTRHTDKAYLQELLHAGVSGYVLKQSDSEELLRAIRVIAKGGEYIDPAITGSLFNLLSSSTSSRTAGPQTNQLSDREAEVLRRIARGYSNKEIADQLDTSVKTVETQKATALRKLDIKGRNEIVNYAILQGWLKEG
ncbi:MAG: response regulator transcription factor [Pyrinomonadaceae bacterium]